MRIIIYQTSNQEMLQNSWGIINSAIQLTIVVYVPAKKKKKK